MAASSPRRLHRRLSARRRSPRKDRATQGNRTIDRPITKGAPHLVVTSFPAVRVAKGGRTRRETHPRRTHLGVGNVDEYELKLLAFAFCRVGKTGSLAARGCMIRRNCNQFALQTDSADAELPDVMHPLWSCFADHLTRGVQPRPRRTTVENSAFTLAGLHGLDGIAGEVQRRRLPGARRHHERTCSKG